MVSYKILIETKEFEGLEEFFKFLPQKIYAISIFDALISFFGNYNNWLKEKWLKLGKTKTSPKWKSQNSSPSYSRMKRILIASNAARSLASGLKQNTQFFYAYLVLPTLKKFIELPMLRVLVWIYGVKNKWSYYGWEETKEWKIYWESISSRRLILNKFWGQRLPITIVIL